MKRFALLGETLGHSVSPMLHKAIYRQLEIDDASYRTVELPVERLKSFFTGFRVGGFDGVNVTIPHKASVIPLLDEVDSKAKLIDAVNCVNRVGNKLTGYNTDLLGFAYSLRQNSVKTENSVFAIVGAGGSAKAVAVALAEGEAKRIFLLNRTPEHAQQLAEIIKTSNDSVEVTICEQTELADHATDIDCIVNATSVGMSPDVDESPVTESIFNSNMVAFDLIYTPLTSRFLQQAKDNGAMTINGLQMLVAQAVYSVEIWMGGNIVAHVDLNALVRDLEKSIN